METNFNSFVGIFDCGSGIDGDEKKMKKEDPHKI
jgi:hypothetical protein